MKKSIEFNPIAAARKVEESYREYIATTIHFADATLQAQLESILSEPRFLAKGPYLEAAPPYRKDKSIADLVGEGILCKSMLKLGGGDIRKFDSNRSLYVHQVRAIRKAAAGRNYAVVTGTGSGKTECFLLPILNDILSEFEQKGPSAGIRAMILYPMNALANDQLKRLRNMLEGTDITFGRYTGDTLEKKEMALSKWREENPGQTKLPNEIISRDEIRKAPPNILLTNYSMLEYLLLRPEDAPLFGEAFGANWRHVAIDEAHIYSGALGTEIAYLLRRLKARIEEETSCPPDLRCYATSATIGSEEDMPKVAEFAQDLFGEPFSNTPDELDVITSVKDQPHDALDSEPWGQLPLGTWSNLRAELLDLGRVSAERVRKILQEAGVPDVILSRMDGENALLGLGNILLGEVSSSKLVNKCSSLLDLTDVSQIEELDIEGLHGDEQGILTLTAMVEVLSSAQRSEDVPILSSRYHSFLRAPEGIFLNMHTKTLIAHKTIAMDYDGKHEMPIYEASVCRHCGQAYILGNEESSIEAKTAWLNPRHEGTDSDDEFIPRKYYRILDSESDADPAENVVWLCPICGTIHDKDDEGSHRFNHQETNRVPIALNQVESRQAVEEEAKCRHCGYQSRAAIQSMRVSPEAAGSVVCYDLVREIPPFEMIEDNDDDDWFSTKDKECRAGSVICFSDKRQDAAFFAPSMERTYGNVTRRQIIREAVVAVAKDASSGGCTPSAAIKWIVEVADRRYPGLLGGDKDGQATAWLLDELAAEDSRNSLEGLGIIRVEPTKFNEGFKDNNVLDFISKCVEQVNNDGLSWLTEDDYIVLAKVCLKLLRERNAIEVPERVASMRGNHEKRGNAVILGSDSASAQKDVVRFAGLSTGVAENKRSMFVRKYARFVHEVEITREDSLKVLQSLFDFLVQYLGGYFKREPYLVGHKEKFRLNKDIWTLYPHQESDVVYRCNSCGCQTHLNTKGVCTTSRCFGRMERMTFADAEEKDRYYKMVYQEKALPLKIEEHTAQLSSKKAREIQSKFIKGDVNILSCTTTFELGVDVGDLRAIFMRNIPPATANYTQRAGRVGRRAGKPGYAITFCRLRPHDIAHFEEPGKIIAGETRVPVCYLNNEAIAMRHVFAVALSEFFRISQKKGNNYSKEYHNFMDLSVEEPRGLIELRSFLFDQPESVRRQLSRVVPYNLPVAEELGVDEWLWVPKLVASPGDLNGVEGGRLPMVHILKHADFVRIEEGIRANEGENDSRASSLMRARGALKKEKTITILAESGILPKYGFPTDLVELHLPEMEESIEENRLSLSRGMRQALREYAPGAEIVAGKTLWKSVGVKKPKGQELKVRRYGKCPECKTFVWPIENYSDVGECPLCHTEFKLEKRMLIPTYGFVGKSVAKGVGLRKPRAKGYLSVYFSQHWSNEAYKASIEFDGGIVYKRYANNGQLCVLNKPKRGFQVCGYCSRSAIGDESIEHTYWCKKSGITPHILYYSALGTSFVSDVLELTIEFNSAPYAEREDWEALMWALFAAASKILEIPETELGGTMYDNEMRSISILIYDDVPGGAGHARQLSDRVPELIRETYNVVDGHCGCGEETCCYGCIANYYNQMRQSKLSRGAAKKLLASLLGNEVEQLQTY